VTPSPTPLPGASLIAFDSQGEVYLLDTSTGLLTNLTRHPAEDRAPAWRSDGGAIAFQSHRDGNWEIYTLDLSDGALARLTEDPAYDGAPAWSPDGTEIAFESYRGPDCETGSGCSLDIYALPATGGEAHRLTENAAGDYGPAWSPDGDWIAFTSWRDGNKEIYVVPAGGGEARNLTQNPADDEDPAWSPDGSALAFVSWRDVDAATGNRNAEIYTLTVDTPEASAEAGAGDAQRITDNPRPDLDPAWDAEGRLVLAAYEPGLPFETYDPYRPGDFCLFRYSETGPDRLTDFDWDDRRPAPAPPQVVSLHSLAERLPPEPATDLMPAPTPAPGALAQVVEVPSILASFTEQPIRVSELVSPSLVAWQQDVLTASGWDFMHMTLGSWRSIDQVRKKEMYEYDYGYLSWHKTGRALDLALEYKVGGVNQMVLVREDLGQNVYWRMYLRAAKQDGSQGEPLKENPWLYWWHIVPDAEPEAYAAGGKRLSIPAGYYVDITAIAKRHGWERIAAYAIEGDYHWSTDSNATEYWHYERADGLVWWDAMRQLYPPEIMAEYVSWEAGLGLAQSEAMMDSKGVPRP
jgi:TolB protein